ncbi:hypothetical protein IMZ48_22485 [Candidatus Bathyarchaeota archaeon]|nr:hypothetical protein [Candidatus Bathyarchaeota archaeon]
MLLEAPDDANAAMDGPGVVLPDSLEGNDSLLIMDPCTIGVKGWKCPGWTMPGSGETPASGGGGCAIPGLGELLISCAGRCWANGCGDVAEDTGDES